MSEKPTDGILWCVLGVTSILTVAGAVVGIA